MSFHECPSDDDDLRHRHCGDISNESICRVSIPCPQHQMNTSCDHYLQDGSSTSSPTPAAAPAPANQQCREGNRRRATRLRRPHFIITNSYTLHHHYVLVLLLLLNYITLTHQQGITFGGILNLDRCYNAMQNAQTDNKISRSEYVSFIQELANNQFKSFQYDAETNTYGNFPTTDFNSFPEQIRQEFNKFACGGINFICDEAYLYTDGTAPNDPVPDPQQEVYLYQVCEGVESAIEDTLPKTEKPTMSPTPGVGPVVEETVLLDYQITVPSFITEGGFMNGDNDESEELKEALLAAVQSWAQDAASELSQDNVFSRKQRKKKHGRVLAVTIDPDRIQYTNVTNAACITEPIQFRDVCLDIQMAIPLQLSGDHSLSAEEIKATLQAKFEEALADGSFYASLPSEVRDYINGISPPKEPEAAQPPPAPPTLQPTDVSIPSTDAVNPNPVVPGATAPVPVPTPKAGNSGIAGIAAGVSVGLVVIIAGFFVFRRRQAQKKRYDNTDSTPSFGKKGSQESWPGLFSAFNPKKKDIQSDDLEWGQRDDSSDDSGSMQSYSSHSSSGSDSSSYYSTSGSSSGSGGPASVSASSASSYGDDNVAPPMNTSQTSGKSSMTSGKSSSSSEKDLTNRAQLYDLSNSEGSGSENRGLLPQGRSDSEIEDDSSAGSSGWESSDGDSSVQSGSVESFDPNTETLGTSVTTSQDGTSTYLEEEMQDRELMPESLNPAKNPVVQREVTMIPVSEGNDDEDSDEMSTDSDNPPQNRQDVAPLAKELDRAIEAGDWAAVGATAAIIASDSDRDDESGVRSTAQSTKSGSNYSVSTGTGASGASEYTADSGLDAARAAEIDELVETGNWDGVVAVAARYADDASMASSPRKTTRGDDVTHHSDESASLESAKSFVTGTTKGSNRSSADGSVSRGSAMRSVAASKSNTSPRGSSGATPPDDDMGTHASSITSSYVSRSGISTSMVSNASSMSHEKQQMNMYRAEVEALVRRVVPDEIDNIDDIMVQFSGREEELIETLKAMQEKSIAQRARAAVQRTAKREKGVLGRTSPDDSSEDNSQSPQSQDASIAIQTMSSDGQVSSNYSSAYTSSGAGDSITEDFAGRSHHSSMYSSHASDGSSYYSRDSESSGYSTHSGRSDEPTAEGSYVTTDDQTGASSISAGVNAGDWRAMGSVPAEMLGEKTGSGKDPLDDLIRGRSRGGPSEADRASGRF